MNIFMNLYLFSIPGTGTVFYSLGHYDHLAGIHDLYLIPEMHLQCAFDHQEQFVLVLVAVPNKVAFYLGQQYLHIVHTSYAVR